MGRRKLWPELKIISHFKMVKSIILRLFSFENRITVGYLLLGVLWMKYSNNLVNLLFDDPGMIDDLPLYKGWFYMLITSLLFWGFLRFHLSKSRRVRTELRNHKLQLQYSVKNKSQALNQVLSEVQAINVELSKKNQLIETKNKELEKAFRELESTQERLAHSDKMKSLGVLASGISHEINNPLNFILGGAVGLQNFIEEHNIENKKLNFCLKSIKTGVDRASNIVRSMNQLSRTTDDYNETCNIYEIISNSLSIVKNQFENRINLVVSVDEEIGNIKGNVGQLHQVFINLLMNASQAIDGQGFIRIEGMLVEDHIKIEISDSGIGIKAEDINKITTPFFTTKEPGKGTGLGLSIGHKIVESHKGIMRFKSELGKGTTVIIQFPLNDSIRNVS